MSDVSEGIDLTPFQVGTGCVECLAAGQWWLHLRRCAKCDLIGCCDTSPNKHATAHFRKTGHFIVTSFEPGEDRFWNYRTGKPFYGPGWRCRDLGLLTSRRPDQTGASQRIGKINSINEHLAYDDGCTPRA